MQCDISLQVHGPVSGLMLVVLDGLLEKSRFQMIAVNSTDALTLVRTSKHVLTSDLSNPWRYNERCSGIHLHYYNQTYSYH